MIAVTVITGRLYLVRWRGGSRLVIAPHPCRAIEIASEEALPCAA